MKILFKHIRLMIFIIILIITSSLCKFMCQQQDKRAVSYTNIFTYYFEICFIILHVTCPFIPPDGNSLTLTDVKVLAALVFGLNFSLTFLRNNFAYTLYSLPFIFSSLSSLHISHNFFNIFFLI